MYASGQFGKGAVNQSFANQELPVDSEILSRQHAYKEVYHLYHEEFEFSVKVLYPGQFEALRKIYCGSYQQFIRSIFESHFWKDNTGGKTKSKFYFSSDKKYVFKIVKAQDIKMFEEMSNGYF